MSDGASLRSALGLNAARTWRFARDTCPAATSAWSTVCVPEVQVDVTVGGGADVPTPTGDPQFFPSVEVFALKTIDVPVGVALIQYKKRQTGDMPDAQLA